MAYRRNDLSKPRNIHPTRNINLNSPPPTIDTVEANLSQAPIPPRHTQPPPQHYSCPYSEVTIERDRDYMEMRLLVQALIQVQRSMAAKKEEAETAVQCELDAKVA